MTVSEAGKVALLWRGNPQERSEATAQNNRLNPVFEALTSLGIHAEPAIYAGDAVDDVREQLLAVDGVLVWVDPISDGQNRTKLDAMLRAVALRGVWVSAHPDVILKMGVKEVLYRTKYVGWGTETHLYRTARAFNQQFPQRLQSAVHGCSNKTAAIAVRACGRSSSFRRLRTRRPSSACCTRAAVAYPKKMPLGDFIRNCEVYFANEGCIVDQPFQPRLRDGMIRCYMGADKVVGFGHQLIKALIPPPPDGPDSPAAQPGPRIMQPACAPAFQTLRTKMESEWVPQMMQLLDVDAESLRSYGTPIFCMDRATPPAKTLMCFARSMSAPCFRFLSKRRQKSRDLYWPGCNRGSATASLDADISTCNRCYASRSFDMRERKLLVEELLLTHLDGAYNLARWIVESDADAQAVVQEGYTHALDQLEKFRAADVRIRLLTIVRQRAYAWIRRQSNLSPFEEANWVDPADTTSRELSREGLKGDLPAALQRLPVEFREILMLDELEGCSYAQLAEILELSMAAVTCRLSQARQLLRREMTEIQRRKSPERVGPNQTIT